MSWLSSRLRAALALVLTVVVCATALTPASVGAQDARDLSIVVTTDGEATRGHNQSLTWRVDVTCSAEVGECGNTVIESQLSPGIVVGDIDVSSAPGFVVVNQTGDTTVAGEPTLVQLQRGSDLLDGETVSFVVHGQVGPTADQGATLDHLVLAASNNTSTASAAAAPVVVANTASWTVSGFASGEATFGRNETHRVAVCGSTEANTEHGDLVLDVALPDGSAIVDSGEGEITPTGLRWLVPAVTAADLAAEHDADLAAGRATEYCHEFFPTVRWGAPSFVLGDALPLTLSLADSSGVAVDSLCVAGCRVDASLSLIASTTVIEAIVAGPDVINAGGLGAWDVTFDASATVEPVQVPLLDVVLPVGLQLERIDLGGLPDGAEAQVYASTDAGNSFAPEPVRTGDTDASMFDRSAFDAAVGASMAINALQIRFTSVADEPLLQAGAQPSIALITSPDPVQPPVGSAELCAMATSANAASIEGRSCYVVPVQDAAASFAPVASVTSPAAPTADQIVSTTVQIPMSNGATIIDPIVGALLPAGFEFRGLDAVNTPAWIAAPPRPIIETTPDHDGTGRTLVTFHWTDTAEGDLASHEFAWTPAEMRADGVYSHLDLELVWRVAAPAGHPAGIDTIDIAATSLISPPASCPEGADLRDDQLGLGTALVCATEATTDTASGASLIQTNLATGIELLPFEPIDPAQTWCDPTRIDDIEWTASTCAAPSTPNGRVQFQTEVTNTGNRDLADVWSYGLLPLLDDVGIDPDTWQTPRASELAASLTGPLVVTGLPEPVEADDAVVEYSSAVDPCRSELSDGLAPWPPACVDDWTTSPQNWADVTAWRVHVPFDRSPLAGATSFEISGEMLVAADADFETLGTAVVAQAGFDSTGAAWVRSEAQPISIVVPREDDIIAADPALLPHDLALIATIDAEDSLDLHDGPHGGDAFVVAIEVINQGAPVDSVDVALHPDLSVVIDAASGSVLTDDGGSISWSVTPGSPAVLALSGTLARADEVRIPLPLRIVEEWASVDWSENPLNLIAEIAWLDAAGASGALVDHDSIADFDPLNDVAPVAPGDAGDGVVTGDGQPDSGVDADPVADDEDDHDIAGVPLWDLALDIVLSDDYDVALDWADPVAGWDVTVENNGPRAAYDITVEQSLPAGMTWVDAGAPTTGEASVTVGDQGQITIDRLDPGAVISWTATARATDSAVHDFVFEAAVTGFADQADLEQDPSPLVRDLDGSDLAGASTVWLPWDVAVALNHRSTTGLPISSATTVAFDLVVQNVGRDIDIAVVDLQLTEAGLGALAPDPSVAIVDELGRPIRTTWDLSDPAQPRIQMERSDGAPLGHGARVVVPVHASVIDLSVDPTALQVTAMLSGLDAAPVPGSTPDQAVSAVDVNPANDQSMLVVPMWDLALSVAEDAPILRTVDDRVVADWTITVENQGNRDATDIVVEVDLGDRLVAETTTPVIVPFLAPGEQVDLVIVSEFTDGFDGSFAVTAQIVSFADANREPQRDVDSRPGELATPDEPFEDDEQRLDRSLPSAIELGVEHRLTTGLPIQPGDSSVTFDVTVRNVGRPLNEIEVVLGAPDLGPVVVDAADAPYTLRAGEGSGSLVLVLPADAPLMPDGVLTLPVTIPIPDDWDGSTPRLVVEAADAKTPVAAPMSFWDVALDVALAPEQSERISTSEPVRWALTVANEGNQDAHAVLIAVALPAGMSWAGAEGSGVSSTAQIGVTGEVLLSLDQVSAGETATVVLSTELNETDRSLFRLVAELVDFDADADPANERNPLAGDIDSTPRNVAAATQADRAGQAELNPGEDDHGAADVSLPADVVVDLVLDPATPPRAGATSSWTISATNQGLDLADATFVLDLDERWVAFDATTLPTVTGGDAALALTWDLTDPMAPQARVAGDWPSAATVTIPLGLTVSSAASAAGTALSIGVATAAVDDDGFPATPAPVLDDVDGDAAALVEVDLFDLALVVRVDASAGLPPEAESVVTFFIDVINQGTVPATNVEVALYPAADQWLPLANDVVALVDAASPLEPGATVTTPITLTLAPDADLGLASLVAEIASASGVDFDSTPDSDSTNDAAPAAAGDPTDDAIDNRSGDEDDHDLADVQPPTSVLGNQVWFDDDHDGLRDDDEQPAAGVLVELLLDANSDGVADDRDLSGIIDNADRLATTTTDADGLFRFDDVAAGTYLIAIPASQFAASGPLAGWSASIQPDDAPVDGANDGRLRSDGGVTSATITVTGSGPLGEEPNNASEMRDERTDLTIDFGLGQWSLGNQVWYDTVENGLFDAGEEGVGGARLYLFVDANEDGTPDDANADGDLTVIDAVATTTADAKGRYRFDGLGAGTYIVAVADVTMRGTLGDWAISRFSRSAYSDRDDDSNAAGWSGLHVLSFPVRMGDGDKVNLTVDFGFELAEVEPIVWPQTDLTGFNNPTTFGQTNDPGFFGPSAGEDLTDFESFGDVDLFEEGEDLGESFDFVEAAFFEDGPEGPLAFTGSNSRTLVSWAAMLIVFGAVLVGVSREPDEG